MATPSTSLHLIPESVRRQAEQAYAQRPVRTVTPDNIPQHMGKPLFGTSGPMGPEWQGSGFEYGYGHAEGEAPRPIVSGSQQFMQNTLGNVTEEPGRPLADVTALMGRDEFMSQATGQPMGQGGQQGQQPLPSQQEFIDNYNVPITSPDYQSPLERRRAVAQAQSADRRAYLLMRRGYRDAARQGRRRRDPEASMRALEIFEQGQARGLNLSGAYQQQPRQQIAATDMAGAQYLNRRNQQ